MQLPSFVSDVTIPPLQYHRMMIDWCRTTRASHPVFYDEAHALWIILRYEDAVHFDDYTTFSSAHWQEYTHPEHFGIERDPNHHRTFGHGIH